MGVMDVGDDEKLELINLNGDILGNILLITHDGVGRTVVTVDLFEKPEPNELFHDENTMAKVILALYNQGMSFADAGKAVDAILDKGIVFREIVPPVV